jgi:energy-coupling factor transport system substrate-specific component
MTPENITPSNAAPRRGLAAWITRDLMIVLAMSIAIGLLFVPLNNFWAGINAVNPIAGWAMSGLFRLPYVLIAYIVRRPGAVMIYQAISSFAWALASPFGLFGMVAGLIVGVMGELSQLIGTRYKTYETRNLVVWGGVDALLGILISGVVFGSLMIEPTVAIPAALLSIVSYIAATLIAPRLAMLIARTGVLGGTALGQLVQKEV